eukprot:UN25292
MCKYHVGMSKEDIDLVLSDRKENWDLDVLLEKYDVDKIKLCDCVSRKSAHVLSGVCGVILVPLLLGTDHMFEYVIGNALRCVVDHSMQTYMYFYMKNPTFLIMLMYGGKCKNSGRKIRTIEYQNSNSVQFVWNFDYVLFGFLDITLF